MQNNEWNLMKITSILEDSTTPAKNVEHGKPSFMDVDNNGEWDLFVFPSTLNRGEMR